MFRLLGIAYVAPSQRGAKIDIVSTGNLLMRDGRLIGLSALETAGGGDVEDEDEDGTVDEAVDEEGKEIGDEDEDEDEDEADYDDGGRGHCTAGDDV